MNNYTIALYIRLSMEDSKYDSLSIEHQKMILNEFALSMPEAQNAEIREFIDNGFSGTNFERPSVQELIELVRENKIDCILVKDFSRFGRNSLEVGYFIERVFPLFHTRFISVSDSFDSNNFKGDTGGMDVAFIQWVSFCAIKQSGCFILCVIRCPKLVFLWPVHFRHWVHCNMILPYSIFFPSDQAAVYTYSLSLSFSFPRRL